MQLLVVRVLLVQRLLCRLRVQKQFVFYLAVPFTYQVYLVCVVLLPAPELLLQRRSPEICVVVYLCHVLNNSKQ